MLGKTKITMGTLAASMLVGVCGMAAEAQTTIRLGPVLNPANKHIYYVVESNQPQNFASMQSFARSLGGDLATIESAEENQWIWTNLAAAIGNKLWIGLNDATTQGSFVWSSGSNASYRNWSPGEPENRTGNDFVQILDGDGRWALRPDRYTSMGAVEVAGPIRVPQTVATIQAAINLAVDGSEILVSPGVYAERLNLNGKDVTIRSSGGAGVTIIDAQLTGPAITAMQGETITLEGLTVTRGRTTSSGGGLTTNGHVRIIDCAFTSNVADGSAANGGAIFGDDAYVNITGSLLDSNNAQYWGGAIFGRNTQFIVSNSTITRNVSGNSSSADSRGVITSEGDQGAAGLVLTNCLVTHNVINGSGSTGSVIYVLESIATIMNCTIADNTTRNAATMRFYDSSALVANTIVKGSPRNPVSFNLSKVRFVNTLTDVDYNYPGFTFGDPMFVDANGADNIPGTPDDDYRLQPGSPAVDAGDDGIYLGGFNDLAGNPRRAGVSAASARIDLGAYELPNTPCVADVDDGSGNGSPDGGVTIEDLLYFLLRYDSGC